MDKASALFKILSGREERAAAQQRMLSGGSKFICQIALNIAGFPKRLDGDRQIIKICRSKIISAFAAAPLCEEELENGAGIAHYILYAGKRENALNLKRVAVDFEEHSLAGRIFDIDIITAIGSISRTELGLPVRSCLLCSKEAKVCARERNHTLEEIRNAARQIIAMTLNETS